MKHGLAAKFISGTAWIALAQVISKIANMAKYVVLAHLLEKSDLGLFLVSMVVLQLFEIVAGTGVVQALIQRRDRVQEFLATGWTAQVVRGIILGAIVIAAAPLCELYLPNSYGLAPILQAHSAVVVIGGFRSIRLVVMERDLAFRPLAYVEVARAAIDLIVTISIAVVSPTAWAPLFGRITSVFFGVVLGHVLAPHRLAISFEWSKFRTLYRFGFWMFLSTLIGFLMIRGGGLVLARVMTLSDVAVYELAYMLGCTPTAELFRVITRAAFSTFSRMQTELGRMQEAYRRLLYTTSVWVSGVVGILTVVSVEITDVLFGDSYASLYRLLPLLAIWGASRTLAENDMVAIQAIGRPNIATLFNASVLVLFALSVVPAAIHGGPLGVAIALAVLGIVSQLVRMVALSRILTLRIGRILVLFALPTAAGAAAAGLAIGTGQLAQLSSSWGALIGKAGVFVVAFLAFIAAVDHWFAREELRSQARYLIGLIRARLEGVVATYRHGP